MTPDTDKLVRQLSLVAYLMAERRASSARDVKQNVEGYYDMSDEAFARRFYADRAELSALGVPIRSQRDEFTGEELYTLRREQYFLPPLHLTDAELAALATGVYLLEGQFAYAEPLRLALQNLALGRPNPSEDSSPGVSLRLLGNGFTAEVAQRLQKIESAVSKQRTIVFPYWAIYSDEQSTRTMDPYSLFLRDGQWYLVGRDHDRDAIRTFRLSRIRGDVRFATRRERDFRIPAEFDATQWRDRAPWQLGETDEIATIRVSPAAAWLVERAASRHGVTSYQDDGSLVFETPFADARLLARWLLDLDGQAVPLGPPDLVEEVTARPRSRRPRARGCRRAARRADRARRALERAARTRRREPRRPRALRRAAGADGGPARPPAETSRARASPQCRWPRATARARDARGASPAAQPRQLRRRLLRGLLSSSSRTARSSRSRRSCTATTSASPRGSLRSRRRRSCSRST